MKTIELTGHVDEQYRLCVEVPASEPPGPVKVLVEVPDPDDDGERGDWAAAVARVWAADWSDPGEEIYTLEDGKPEHEPR
jgi:hypothetical protein